VRVYDWREIEATIPASFQHRRDLPDPPPPGNHNGASSPFRAFYPLIYSDQTRIDIDDASFIHDWGYMFARLPGSGWSHLKRADWDRVYRQWYLDHDHPRIGWLHYGVLRALGSSAWRRNAELMVEWGYAEYSDYTTRKGIAQIAKDGWRGGCRSVFKS